MTKDNSIIKISKLNKWYGKFHALKDIDLSVGAKEKIVICGPSGSGKSTLIRCINRLEVHQEGSIIVSRTSFIISGSSADVGSSKSMILGCMHKARAIATLCC